MMREPKFTNVKQRGAVMFVTLILLLVVTVLSLASMRSSTQEMRMAINEEARVSALEAAQAVTDAVIAFPSTTPVIGGAGFTICTPGQSGCNVSNMAFPGGLFASEIAAGHLSARVQRMVPADRPPPRGIDSSVDKFTAAAFQVQTTFDRADEGLGRAQVVEGLLVLVSTD